MASTEGGKLYEEVKAVMLFLSEEIFLSEEVNFVVLYKEELRKEESVFSVFLSSATQEEEWPPVLAKEEVNERE